MLYNRCKDIHKFGNKYLPLAYKMQVDFRSHFSGKKVCLIVREIRYLFILLGYDAVRLGGQFHTLQRIIVPSIFRGLQVEE